MRVTKIIREYVTREIDKKKREQIDAIERVEPVYKTEEWNALHDQYMDYAEAKLDEYLSMLATKRAELGFELKDTYKSDINSYDKKIKSSIIYRGTYANCPISLKDKVVDKAYDEYQAKIIEIRDTYNAKIDDTLIKLELGEMKKQELEEVLAQI